MDKRDIEALAHAGAQAREIVYAAPMPAAVEEAIRRAWRDLKAQVGPNLSVAVRSDQAASGVMFTIDTESGHPDVAFITAAWGLGENVVQGAVDPDEFYVHKPTFRAGHRCVLRKRLGRKQIRMAYSGGRTREPVVNPPTPTEDRARFCLSDADVLELADAAIKIEDHYTQRAGAWRPMDIEWAKDGPDGKLYIVQARPETSAFLGPRCQSSFRHLVAVFRLFRRTLAVFAAFAMCLMRLGSLRETAGPVPSANAAAGGDSTLLRRTPTEVEGSAMPGGKMVELCARAAGMDTGDVAGQALAVLATPRPAFARSSDVAVARTSMKVALTVSLVAEARDLGVDVSLAAEAGLAAAVSVRRQERWLTENNAALDSSNDYVAQRGLQLTRLRTT